MSPFCKELRGESVFSSWAAVGGCSEHTELTGRSLPTPVENVVFVNLQFSAGKFQFYWKKKIDFSDQKIKVMVRGYLPWQPLSIPLSARREKARWTKPSPVRELRVPPPTHTHKELLRLFIPQRMWELYFLSWNTTEHFFHRMKIPVFGQPESKLLETWGQIFGLYKLASSIVFSPQRIWP